MRLFAAIVFILICGFSLTAGAAPSRTPADWTVIIYMNAKNNLESAAMANLAQLVSVGSTDRVNYIVEFGVPAGVKRFRVTKEMKDSTVVDLGSTGVLTDMGRPEALEDFLVWSRSQFPAAHYMLIIWSHGQGWRLEQETAESARTLRLNRAALSRARGTYSSDLPGGFRVVSTDDVTGHSLYNHQIQTVLERLAHSGSKIDILGFDACLMSMIETAFAMRSGAKYLVSSEELVPGSGWPYLFWTKALNLNPGMSPATVSQMLVGEYRAQYATSAEQELTTLSAIDLEQVSQTTQALSDFATALTADLDRERGAVATARNGQQAFGSWYTGLNTSVDLPDFLARFERASSNAKLSGLAARARDAVRRMTVANYASASVSQQGYGGSGLAIFLPATRQDFNDDPYHDAYIPGNAVEQPVDFVEQSSWSRLVMKYLSIQPH